MFTFRIKYHLLIMLFVIFNTCALHSYPSLNISKMQLKYPSIIWPTSASSFNYQEQNQLKQDYLEPLFEDYKPRNIGDTLTVILQENMSASNNMSDNSVHNRNSNIGMTLGNDTERRLEKNNKFEFNTSLDNSFLNKGGTFANNKFVGLITVTVDEILSNGNLVVSGNKNILINEEQEIIHFQGIVNPRTISKNNSVLSTQIANTNIKYVNTNSINQGGNINWLRRLFLGILTLSK